VLSYALASFPATRVWGELLNQYLLNLAMDMGSAFLRAIPGLFTAFVIFYLTRTATRLLDGFFTRVRNEKIKVSWLDADVAEPTRRIVKAVVWLFALAMAYPYLPGAHTEAFQGLSVLVGLMISLGASNLVGQAASGLVLIYGRVFRKGEYIKIGNHEGTVMDMGMFTTRIRTGMGEDITLANNNVLNDTTKNYSSARKNAGFVLDTQVTIGYDTPWRQVHALLELAARRTPGILADPAPQVFQTSLSDWYPQYRLVCQAGPSDPRSRAMMLSALHEGIQDVFNEYGVQIMSPQYFEDPKEAKIVPPDKWFTAPAVKPE
jgi:small-conductance mechanosensitive channel